MIKDNDIIDEDDLVEVGSVQRSTTSRSSSSTITTTPRRPMYIETEMRTDLRSTRTGPTMNVNEVLEKTRSPTDGLPQTTYTYAHSVSYMPVTQNGTYEVPVMARRNLHGENGINGGSGAFSSPQRFMSNVRTQIADRFSAFVSGKSHQQNQQQPQQSDLFDNEQHQTTGGSRYTRTSSQSSTSNSRNTVGSSSTGYNLRSRPVHSTPRENEENEVRQRQQQKYSQQQEADYSTSEYDRNKRYQQQEQQSSHKYRDDRDHDYDDRENDGTLVGKVKRYFRNIIHSPMDFFKSIFHAIGSLPFWLLIPLILLLALYAVPWLVCRRVEHYPQSLPYALCSGVKNFTSSLTNNTYNFARHNTYDRVKHGIRRGSRTANDLRDSIYSSLEDVYYSGKKLLKTSVGEVKGKVADVYDSTTDNAKQYCDAGLKKMNTVIEDLKKEREKVLGPRHVLTQTQEKELEEMVRQMLDDYSADEIGEPDYALESNGAKVVDTRCTEYADEPRQNVVKFLGIPVAHMSKQPDIMLRPGRLPGQCFPFKGDQGSIVIKLAVPVVPTEFVLEHLSKRISIVGHVNSAPKNFTIYALRDKHDKEGTVLGRYYYDTENGPALQRFKPQISPVPTCEYIEIQVTSNWGNPNYTCVYRFRVHGDLIQITPSAPPAPAA
ncbi:unnamed protein product [Didymodactylos carnosus]|uniref:SUN domain-containing protein n=1 Tax=Didymodactylos carnosus TaxID=1234261 RepID=A0A813TBG4_9BILA|nr:unnamed protein product [Didymodactylos carnosus]CAF1074838.1 unnamed protein product [Didymodactylos carnosus]CAF3595860.1 unnamed protein product [Didymodactylos carnosus]CAF3838720.1 unnamed protein product [Didymodactylos carnosus]